MDETTPEEWCPVVGYEGLYEVSSIGRVRTLPHVTKGHTIRGRIKKPTPMPAGHLVVTLCKDGVPSPPQLVHRLMMAAFVGPCPPGEEVRHMDGVPDHNVLSNLEYGDRSKQREDDVRNGVHFNAAKTHCPQGHEYTPENTYVTPMGGRTCQICGKERKRRWYEAHREITIQRATEPNRRNRKRAS